MNINTVADLLNELVEREKKKIASFGEITHPGTIGDMYEGLSKRLINAAIFKGLGLKVVDGFVRGENGILSKQIDCMVVVGDGEQLPNTSHYIYDFENVIAVIESKKNLYSDEIESSYENMQSVSDIFVPSDKTGVTYQDVVDAFEDLTAKKIKFPITQMDETSQMLWHVLVVMFAMPIRIVIGYDGFKSELNFREAYFKYMKKRLCTMGTGPNSMPDLIICDNYSLVKGNFQPLRPHQLDDGFIPILVSGTENPLFYLVSMIWRKLQIKFNLPDEIWDFDTDSNCQVKRFLDVRLERIGDRMGWGLKFFQMSEDELNNPPPKEDWKPFEVSKEVFIVANILCRIAPKEYNLKETGHTKEIIDSMKKEMADTRLFAIEGDNVSLLSHELMCCMHEGKNLIGDNRDRDFDLWLRKIKNMEK